MTTEVPGPLNNLSSSVLTLQTKETLGHRVIASQEPTVNQSPPCGSMSVSTRSSHRTHPSWSASACRKEPSVSSGAIGRRRSVMPIFHLPACARATPPRNCRIPFSLFPSAAFKICPPPTPSVKDYPTLPGSTDPFPYFLGNS